MPAAIINFEKRKKKLVYYIFIHFVFFLVYFHTFNHKSHNILCPKTKQKKIKHTKQNWSRTMIRIRTSKNKNENKTCHTHGKWLDY